MNKIGWHVGKRTGRGPLLVKHAQPEGMKHLVVPAEIKEVSDVGVVTGYASIFGNVDLGGDVISRDEPFKEFAANPDGKILHLFQHDAYGRTASGGLPIGLAEVEQTRKGLKFKSQLVMEDDFVKRVHTHFKAGTLTGMSIGYDVLPGGYEYDEGKGTRKLTALKLWEISSVTFGMNPKAGIDSVKALEKVNSVREVEDWLRDAVGLSKSQATLHASAIWKTLSNRGEPGADAEVAASVQRMTDFLKQV
jgi:uncharacterized protein